MTQSNASASADLVRAIFLANPGLLERLERFAAEILQALAPPERWSERVTDRLARALLRGDPPPPPAEQTAGGGDHLPRPPRRPAAGDRSALPAAARGPPRRDRLPPGLRRTERLHHAFKGWTGAAPRHYRDTALAGRP